MNFPEVNEDPCPDDLSATESLLVKPSFTSECSGEVQFKAYLRSDSAGETLLSTGLTWSSSNPAAVTINTSTGLATIVAAGIATISVAYTTLQAAAQIEVMGAACCDDTVVATELMIDNSRSMSATMANGQTRLAWSKQIAYAFMSAINLAKDFIGLSRFNVSVTEIQAIEAVLPSWATVNAIAQSTQNTDIKKMLLAGIASLNAATADRRVLVIFSDGENKLTSYAPIPSSDDIIELATEFKSAGGIIICIGAAASSDGFALLQAISSGGFFLNASTEIATDAVQDNLIGLLCYYCGVTPGYPQCLSEALPAQTPLSPALATLEF